MLLSPGFYHTTQQKPPNMTHHNTERPFLYFVIDGFEILDMEEVNEEMPDGRFEQVDTVEPYLQKKFYAPGNKKIYLELKQKHHTVLKKFKKKNRNEYEYRLIPFYEFICSNCGHRVIARINDISRLSNPCSCCYEDLEAAIDANLRVQYKRLKQRHIHKHHGTPDELISFEEFKGICLSDTCTYCGSHADIDMYSDKGTYLGRKMSIDRIDSTGGYTLENCTASCMQCNRTKHQMLPIEFMAYVEKIYRFNFG